MTRVVGSFWMKPTVSVIKTSRPPGSVEPPSRRVKCSEELVGGQHISPAQRVQQRRLARVGVANQCNNRDALIEAPPPMLSSLGSNFLDLLLEVRDATPHLTAIDLQLRLAGAAQPHTARAAARCRAAALARQMRPGSSQPGQAILVLGQLDL